MIQLIRQALSHQYTAALMMLERCIEQCSAEHWGDQVGKYPFWHVAYHVLFFTDLYLSAGEGKFERRAFHREDYHFLGRQPWPPFKEVAAERAYDRATLLEYVRMCMEKAGRSVAEETEESLAGPSGFDWVPITRMETHVYNIRHVQHHTGQLSAFLIRVQGKGAGWIGTED